MKPNLIIFDFDGVIVNTEDIFLQQLYKTLKNFNISIPFNEIRSAFVGNDTYTTLKRVIKQYNPSINVDEVFNDLTSKKHDWINNVTKNPYIDELLNTLKIPFCIASNSNTNHIMNTLKIIKLDHFFTKKNIFSAYDVGSYKPEPTVYLEALKNMGFAAEKSIAIEDSIPGLTASIAAGIPTIGYIGSIHVDFKKQSELLTQHGTFLNIKSFKEIINMFT